MRGSSIERCRPRTRRDSLLAHSANLQPGIWQPRCSPSDQFGPSRGRDSAGAVLALVTSIDDRSFAVSASIGRVLRPSLALVTIDRMPIELPRLSSDAPIFVRLLPKLATMVEAALAAGVAAVPEGAALPKDHFADIVPLSLEYAALFLKRIDDGESITREDLSSLEVLVTNFAEDRVPLRSLTDGYLGGLEVFWQLIVEVAEPSDIHDLAALGAHVFATIRMLTTTVTDAYVDVQQSIFGLERESRRELCAALLRGEPADGLAARAGAAIAESYDVIAILAGAGLAPTEPADALVKRRWARWTQQALDDIAGASVRREQRSGVAASRRRRSRTRDAAPCR